MLIHELISLTRPFIVLDVETTGFDPKVERIVELGFQVWTAAGLESEWRSLINPGRPIPPEVTAVHHITDEMMLSCRLCGRTTDLHPPNGTLEDCAEFHMVPTFSQIAKRIAHGFSNCDFGGKRVRFDLEFVAEEMRRSVVEWDYSTAHVIDCDRLEQIAEPRSLSDLYRKYTGEELLDAHSALVDVRATTVVIGHQLTRYETLLPRSLQRLHELSWPGWIDPEGKFRFDLEGVPRITFGKHKGVALDRVPKSYFKWLTEADFGPGTKHIAGEALAGRFPKR